MSREAIKEKKRVLPPGWRWVRLGEVCDVVTGSTPPRSEKRFYGGETPWVKPDDLDRDMFVSSSCEYLSEAGVAVARLLPKGAVLVSCIGKIGKAAIADCSLATNQQINALLPGIDVDSVFLFFCCQQMRAHWESNASVALVPILNKSDFALMEIPLPPLAEQRRIAGVLCEQMAAVDKARAAAQVRLAALKALPAAFVRESLRKGQRHRHRLGECLIEVRNGVGADWSNYPVLGATRDGLAPAKESVGKTPDRYKLVDPGTVFYNPMRILLGSIAMVDEGDATGITSPDYVVVKGRPGILETRWFYYWFRSSQGAQLIDSLSRGAVRERILFNRLAAGKIEIPDHETQIKASNRMKEVRAAALSITEELETINALPAALLRRVFSGEI